CDCRRVQSIPARGQNFSLDGPHMHCDLHHIAGGVPAATIAGRLKQHGDSVNRLLTFAMLVAIPGAGIAQTSDEFGVKDKLYFHAKYAYGPMALLGAAAYAG